MFYKAFNNDVDNFLQMPLMWEVLLMIHIQLNDLLLRKLLLNGGD